MTPAGPADLGFVHRFVPAARQAARHTLLLLHGTGGGEDDLLPLGRRLAPGAALLSPRGKVLEHGMPRFFRRLAEGVFDLEDLERRTHELGDFVAASAAHYGFDPARVAAVGYSNGANIAANLLMRRPRAIGAAALFRPMAPPEPPSLPDLLGIHVFASIGTEDPLVTPDRAERLLGLLGRCGARVAARWEPAGHALVEDEIDAAREWLARWASGAESGWRAASGEE